jgi:hypothetical protein
MVTALSGYAVARIIAVSVAGSIDTYNGAAIAYEVVSAGLGFWALRVLSPGR